MDLLESLGSSSGSTDCLSAKTINIQPKGRTVLNNLGSEDVMPNPNKFPICPLEIGRQQSHFRNRILFRIDIDPVSNIIRMLDE